MGLLQKSCDLPTSDTALPGRTDSMPVPAEHFVNGNPLRGPFSAWAVSGVPSDDSGNEMEYFPQQPATGAASRRTKVTKRSVPVAPDTTKWFRRIRLKACARVTTRVPSIVPVSMPRVKNSWSRQKPAKRSFRGA
ncbi:MAG: hypothetical protein ACI9HA_001151 [Dinoroseobacter sp.]|jgi:hypothetical protein